MTTCTRWMAVCVDMLDHPIVGMAAGSPKAANSKLPVQSYCIAWLDLLRAAAWREIAVSHKGKSLTLRRGEFLAGRAFWATRWNWGEQAVRTYFGKLCSEKMIAFCNQSDGHLANVASVCNYDNYQTRQTKQKPVEQPEPNQRVTRAQPEGNQNTTKNTNTTILQKKEQTDGPEQVADAREEKCVCPSDDLKKAFNGSTERMLAEVERAMAKNSGYVGQSDRKLAENWLAELVQINGSDAVSQAYQMIQNAKLRGEVIAKIIPYWSKTAHALKLNAEAKKPAKKAQITPEQRAANEAAMDVLLAEARVRDHAEKKKFFMEKNAACQQSPTSSTNTASPSAATPTAASTPPAPNAPTSDQKPANEKNASAYW
jgi:hypothetical protein